MTSIATVDFGSQVWPADDDAGLPAAMPPMPGGQASDLGNNRDAQIADLATTSAGVNQLQSLASSATPAPALPSVQQQTQAQQSAAQPPLKLDSYADGDDGE